MNDQTSPLRHTVPLSCMSDTRQISLPLRVLCLLPLAVVGHNWASDECVAVAKRNEANTASP